LSLFQWFADMRGVVRELRRIADAAERAFPVPSSEPPEITEADDITYASDEQTARQEMLAEAKRLGLLDEAKEAELNEDS